MISTTHRRVAIAASLAATLAVASAAQAGPGDISTDAGGGTQWRGDGGPATDAMMSGPTGVSAMPDGGYLIADRDDNRIRRVYPDGTIRTIAGNAGVNGTEEDGVAPKNARLHEPSGVAVLSSRVYLIAERGMNRIRRVNGTRITTVAGNSSAGSAGDGGPATSASLNAPTSISWTADRGFLIADTGNDKIRHVSRTGTITTVAGTGSLPSGGDGGPATAAGLTRPMGVTVTANGGFLIAETGAHKIRSVDPAGTIRTVAGNGTAGSAGDGGFATNAQLREPWAVVPSATGGLVIADTRNNKVRSVSRWGFIGTLAGTGSSALPLGDGGPATAATLATPASLAFIPRGLLIADGSNRRIRLVEDNLRVPRPVEPVVAAPRL